MTKFRAALILSLGFLITILTCIDPYVPELEKYENILVVEGMITDENSSYVVRLSKTLKDLDAEPSAIVDATVFISDNAGSECKLKHISGGEYRTDSTFFRGIAGRSYVLHIITNEGAEYVSDQCTMMDVPEIDSIWFKKDLEFVNNGSEANEGLQIYLKSKKGDINRYYRWSFDETWLFKVPTAKKAIYIDEKTILMTTDFNEYCWKSKKSDAIIINSVYSEASDRIGYQPICFIASDRSDRLMIKYSINVKQYSISKNEFDFWENMKKINESGSDIFASQPFTVTSNIHNKNDPSERVLGYFQVSSVTQKRINLTFNDIIKLDLPLYHYPCERIEASPKDHPWNKFVPPPTFDELNEIFVSLGYYFVEPKYFHGTLLLDQLVFARPVCADCELSGSGVEPDFWKDNFN